MREDILVIITDKDIEGTFKIAGLKDHYHQPIYHQYNATHLQNEERRHSSRPNPKNRRPASQIQGQKEITRSPFQRKQTLL
jgi:hypothetical protein